MGRAKVIYKYNFTDDTRGILEVPWTSTSKVIHVGKQFKYSNLPTVWVEHDQDEIYTASDALPRIKLFIVGTGNVFDDSLEYVGTCIVQEGAFVWHVYLGK